MQFKDFISDILTISFITKDEYSLFNYLKKELSELGYDPEFMVNNPFTVQNVIDKVGICAWRDQSLDFILDDKMSKKILVIDFSMISATKKFSQYEVNRKLLEIIQENKRIPVICLIRLNREVSSGENHWGTLKNGLSSTRIIEDSTNVLLYKRKEFIIIKSRNYSNGNFEINTGV